jgi:pyruvate kinase
MKFDYSITVTLGPACAHEPAWDALISAGASAFRLNTSHLSFSELEVWLGRIQSFYAGGAKTLPVVLDLQGSKWRLGKIEPVALLEGQLITLVCSEASTQAGVLPVPHLDFFTAASVSGSEIVLNDAKIRLQMESVAAERMIARVIRGGMISSNKGITYVSSAFRQERLSEKDRAILARTADLEFIRYAISYVKDAVEIKNFRAQVDLLQPNPARQPYLVAKLERQPALDEVAEIARWVDELWLCRGDLGAELGIPGMAAAAYQFTRRVRDLPIPVVLAGQVLEHMTASSSPTRSEVYTLYDALMNGYSGFVLSDEIAIGRFPIESCLTAAMFH